MKFFKALFNAMIEARMMAAREQVRRMQKDRNIDFHAVI